MTAQQTGRTHFSNRRPDPGRDGDAHRQPLRPARRRIARVGRISVEDLTAITSDEPVADERGRRPDASTRSVAATSR